MLGVKGVSKKVIAIVVSFLMILSLIAIAPFSAMADGTTKFEDQLKNLDKVSSKSDNWETFEEHVESGLSVAGKTDTKEGFLTYKSDGNVITDFSVGLQLRPDFFELDRDVSVQVRKAGTEDWVTIEIEEGAKEQIIHGNHDKYYKLALNATDTLPEDIVEIKLVLTNDVPWTLLVDYVNVTFGTPEEPIPTDKPTESTEKPTKPTEKPTEPTEKPTEPEATTAPVEQFVDFFDDLKDFDKLSSKSDNWELFEEHAETGLSVAGKTDTKPGYMTYKFDDRKIINFSFGLQLHPEFFELERDIGVYIRLANSNTWTPFNVKLSASEAIEYQGQKKFHKANVIPAADLPDNVAEIRIELGNDVPWTLMLDNVSLRLESTLTVDTGTGGGGTIGGGATGGPATGVASATAVFAVASIAGLVLYSTKKRNALSK